MAVDVKKAFVKGSIDVLNKAGWQYASQVFGYKKYLLNIYKGNQIDNNDSDFWDNYLVYADLFHIYSEVEPWIKDHYIEPYHYGYYYMYTSFRSSYEEGERLHSSSGDGGSASSGGGGGATGGGGGGSR